jgi:serine/threonine protein phosphatase PrpC
MNCPTCGADNREGARFCRRCGSEISVPDTDQSSPAIEASPVEQPLPEPPPEAEIEGPVEPPGSRPEGAEEAEATPDETAAGGQEGHEPPAEAGALDVEPAAAEVGPAASETSLGPEQGADQDVKAGDDQIGEIDAMGESEEEDEPLSFWRDEPAPLAEASPGTVLAGRYLVVEAIDIQEDAILYQARDLGRCWHCGLEGDLSQETFCPRCGASLDRRPGVRLIQARDPAAEPPAGEKVSTRLSDGEMNLLVLAAAEAVEAAAPEIRGIRLLVGQCSDPGIVRELDEDSLLTMTLAPTYLSHTGPVLGLFAVADGMGGHESGEVASRMALQVLADRLMRDAVLPELAGQLALDEDLLARLRQATMAANDAVYLARQKRSNDMGTTLTTAFIRDDRLFLAHVGDCRAYRWNDQGLQQLTTDHSVVASMVAKGEAAPDDVYTHPHRSVIYRCVGDRPSVEVDADVLPLEPGDRIILCCDGLWEMVRDEGIEDVMLQESNPQTACDLLVKHANLAGGEDNISVIVVQVEAL